MKILLFGVSNVGKTTTGELLAERIGFTFYDLDDEVRRYFDVSLEEFVHTENLRWRDQQRGMIINDIIRLEDDIVFAISPISHPDYFKREIISDDILLIELYDTPDNIFDRLVFSDEHDVIYRDEEYKQRHKDRLLNEIQDDIHWYSGIYAGIGVQNRVFVNNDPQEKVVDRIIAEYGLNNFKKDI